MVRPPARALAAVGGSPHPRGDGPTGSLIRRCSAAFSPPAWGWSAANPTLDVSWDVLPTRVGMVRGAAVACSAWLGSPHPRGDGPIDEMPDRILAKFSPPAWGWSVTEKTTCGRKLVLPTRVGMVRKVASAFKQSRRSPHPRGDGPNLLFVMGSGSGFSPPAWGWSVPGDVHRACKAVLPTRVGMVRTTASPLAASSRSPHPRGDGPQVKQPCASLPLFSPPAWGWSVSTFRLDKSGLVLPTRVGMVR